MEYMPVYVQKMSNIQSSYKNHGDTEWIYQSCRLIVEYSNFVAKIGIKKWEFLSPDSDDSLAWMKPI